MAVPATEAVGFASGLKAWWRENAWILQRRLQQEWFGSPFHLVALKGRRPDGVAAQPRNPRPADVRRGQNLVQGIFNFAGHTIPLGPEGEPFDRPNPSRAFAEELHRMDWLGDLIAAGGAGEVQALRLCLEWRRVFGGWNNFSWGAPLLERRTFNMACALRPMARHASDLEAGRLNEALARQARQLLILADGPAHSAEHACAAAVAGAALGGAAGERLLRKSLERLNDALPQTVLPDGGHASRSPAAGLSLLLDLLALEDGLSQRGWPAPEEMGRALDRLGGALRVLAAPDGRLACFQGGEAGAAEAVAAARRASDHAGGSAALSLPQMGYERLGGYALTVIADTAGPAYGAWSETACAQPAAIEVWSGSDRLVTNCGWSPRGAAPEALRMTTAASTLCVGEGSTGEPARGRIGKDFRARLRGGPSEVTCRRQETDQGQWLEIVHDGWEPSFGLIHERLLYLDRSADELRGEDRLTPVAGGRAGKVTAMTVRFHLHPSVKASLARDRKSVLLQGPNSAGRWLRNDAEDVAIEHSVHYEDGQPRRSTQVVLRTQIRADQGGRVRWKLAAINGG